MRWAPILQTLRRPRVIAAAVGLLLVVGGWAALGRIALATAKSRAHERGLELDAEASSVGIFSVTLHGVSVRPEGVSGVAAALDRVDVDLAATLRPRAVGLRGGVIHLSGSADDVKDELDAWRKRHPRSPSDGGEASGGGLRVRTEGLGVDWRLSEDERLEVSGVDATRDGKALSVAVAHATWARPSSAIACDDVVASFDGSKIQHFESGVMRLVAYAEQPVDPKAQKPKLEDPAEAKHPAETIAGDKSQEARAVRLPLPDPRTMRVALRELAREISERLPDDATVKLDELSVQIVRGSEILSLGRGPLAVERHGKDLRVSYATQAEPGASPLQMNALLPLGDGDATVRFAGGPVPLSVLGAEEGKLGLVDVGRARISARGDVRLVSSGDKLAFDLTASGEDLGIGHKKLATDPIRGLDLRVHGRGVVQTGGTLRIDAAEFQIGEALVKAAGRLEQGKDFVRADGTFEVPLVSCSALLASVPKALAPHLEGTTMTGTFAARGSFGGDSREWEALKLVYDMDELCHLTNVGSDLEKTRFEKPFEHTVYAPDGKTEVAEIGPDTPTWAKLGEISPFMIAAVLTTEDGAFFRHHGFNHAAIRSALVDNLKAGRFRRGASTISMQLTKNLFLSREKTLSRKLEEIILTDYLEENFTKDEIMELYLNVVEFGPNIYGILPASAHYFGRHPSELNIKEAFFLASLLPSPISYHRQYEQKKVWDSWERNLAFFMKTAFERGRITQAELDMGLAQAIVFYDEKDGPLTPRGPVTGTRLFGDMEDEWKAVGDPD